MMKSFKTRLFLILLLSGFVGVLSFLLVDLSAIIALVPVSPGSEALTMPMIKLLGLIQPTVLLAVAVLIGIALAPKVGLSAPFAECLAGGGQCFPALKPQLMPGLVGALVGALLIILTSLVFRPFFMNETIERIREFGTFVPIPTRLLYGGITEELLMRWGLMTLFVWVGWRLLGKKHINPTKIYFVAAIFISSLIFGMGHLPIALAIIPESSAVIIPFVILANSAFGFVAGYLYWKYGLESAVIAHMICHVILAVAQYAGLYF